MKQEIPIIQAKVTTHARRRHRRHLVFDITHRQSGARPDFYSRQPAGCRDLAFHWLERHQSRSKPAPVRGYCLFVVHRGSAATGLGSMKIASLPLCSWGVASFFLPCCSTPRP